MKRGIGILFAISGMVRAQSLVEPERAAEVRQVFERGGGGAPLRCEISAVRPALSFGFRFETGYRLAIPMAQFGGEGHEVKVYVRVIPEGRTPVYLNTMHALPALADRKSEAVADGMFAVGEGGYAVDVMAVDDQQRACRGTWQIQAKAAGNERQVAQAMAPDTVAEVSSGISRRDAAARPAEIASLTILLHAAALVPNRPKLLPDDVALLTDSVATLMRQWPARSVRVIAFNLDQRSVLWQKDGFTAGDIDGLASRLEQLDLGTVNYQVLQGRDKPMEMLTGLIHRALQGPISPDAILLLGPPSQTRDQDVSQLVEKSTKPIFYLQYLPRQRIIPGSTGMAGGRAGRMRNAGVHGPDDFGTGWEAMSAPAGPVSVSMADAIQRLVTRFKGETIAVRTPHDLAEAIHRIDPRIARTSPPPETAPKVESSAGGFTTPELPRAAEPVVPEPGLKRPEDPIEVLAALRDRVLEHGQQIPNHTCVETVERSRFHHTGEPLKSCDAILAARHGVGASGRLRLASTDRLRLDVALTSEREIYSWAGANRFEDADIDEVVPHGAMGSGPFASFLLGVFGGRPQRFVFEGETSGEGRTLYEYSFQVPRDESHYRFKAHKEWIITGYSGTLLVDPRTSDLVRLTVRSDELPPETQTCEVDTTLDYSKVLLREGMVFLPSSTTQKFVARDGEEAENVYTFRACRDFRAESRVDFGDGPYGGTGQAERREAALHWTAGLPVTIEVIDGIDPATAAAGDIIHGRVLQAVRDRNGQTLAPQGAAVTGRLMRVEVRYPSPQVSIALRWETVDLGGKAVALELAPNRDLKAKPGVQLGGIASLANLANLRRRGVEFELPLPGEERYGIYHFPGSHYVVPRGLRTEWVTAMH